MPHPTLLSESEWTAQARAHQVRAAEFTDAHLARRQAHVKHPIFDFLFEYYPVRPAQLRTWHPGISVRLAGSPPHTGWRDYTLLDDHPAGTGVDARSYLTRRGGAVDRIHHLLTTTAGSTAHFDCFGLHEWAMVYRAERIRHDLPLRLGQAGTDAVVEAHQLRCTHFDAFRFFTPSAVPLNLTVLTREEQARTDQCGCLHVTMDLYKWAAKLGPLIPGELLLDTFELARDTRILDMEASPYDCRGHGFGIVSIETPGGKAEYVARQRELSRRAKPLRDRLVSAIESTRAATLTR